VARLEQAVEEEIRRMREDSLTPSEIEGSKAVLLNRVRYESETVEGQARHLAYLDTYAPLMDEKLFQERVEAVSVEMVRQNLLRYLTPLNYAVAVVGPPAPPPTPTTAEKTGGYLR
jgi:predicted Zn-dependent peptidase